MKQFPLIYSGFFTNSTLESIFIWTKDDSLYLADFGRHEVAEPVEPRHVGLEVTGFFHILEGCLQVG